uniref:Retrovirus-related Pol polyprotein from transposon TNT 1-94 n=1 Tax=Cajanus cajan TaxID=3821 RepID=A0A151S5W5_CAJCA|nr:Retrovirus-related Pol polyprotein from transposon TNT 1-94 [Cajanus cajan]
MNKTLVERVRCMLSEAKLPKNFWGEAFFAAVHVINLSPVVTLNIEVPNKIWFGIKVSYDYLRVFDYKAFVHILKDERSKLDTKTRQCIFFGYGQDEFDYRFYDPVEKKLVRSHDVQFMEDQTIEDINKVEKTTPVKDNNLTDGNPMWLPFDNLDNIETDAQKMRNMVMLMINRLEMYYRFQLTMLKRNMIWYMMMILIIFMNYHKSLLGGPTG